MFQGSLRSYESPVIRQTKAQYAKGKTPDTKCHVVWCRFHFHEMSRRGKSLLIKSRPVAAQGWGKRGLGSGSQWVRVSFRGGERVPELVGISHDPMNIRIMPVELYALKMVNVMVNLFSVKTEKQAEP